MYEKADQYADSWFDILERAAIMGVPTRVRCASEKEARSYRAAWYQFHRALRKDKHAKAPLANHIAVRVEGSDCCIEPRKAGRFDQLAIQALQEAGHATVVQPSDALLAVVAEKSQFDLSRVQAKVNAYLKGDTDVPATTPSEDRPAAAQGPGRDDHEGGVERGRRSSPGGAGDSLHDGPPVQGEEGSEKR